METESHAALSSRLWARIPFIPLIIVGFSVFYFTDVILRASEKYFWYDELFTLYLCRLSWQELGHALARAIDSNPPLFYALTKASEWVFGENRIGLRVPEMLGLWILCLCLFQFVRRRVGVTAAIVAMLFPIFTEAFYYAYEARPHGIVLGFCGLALLAWQRSLESMNLRWSLWFALALFCAFMTHCYALVIAVPFGIAELTRAYQLRRTSVRRWLPIAVPAFVAAAVYVPLLRYYSSVTKGTNFVDLSPPVLPQIPNFYFFLLGPCISLVLITFVALALNEVLNRHSFPFEASVALTEVALAISFFALPVFGLLLAYTVHASYFSRYFLSAVVGVSLLSGLAIGGRRPNNRASKVLAGVFLWAAAWNISALWWHRHLHIPEDLREPSSGFAMNSTLGGPLERYSPVLRKIHKDEPIGILDPVEFLYLLNYSPETRASLYYIQSGTTDFFVRGYDNFLPFSPIKYNRPITREGFLGLAPISIVCGYTTVAQITPFLQLGAKIRSLTAFQGHFSAEIASPSAHTPSGS